jgi:putative Holliday junction resolvase
VDAIELAEALARRIAPTPVRMSDERLTTVAAQRSLRDAGIRAKGQRTMVDQAAAVEILQNWLDQRRAALAARGEVGDD